MKKAALKTFAVFSGKRRWWMESLCNFIKKTLQHRCFHVNIAKVLTTPVLKNVCERHSFYSQSCFRFSVRNVIQKVQMPRILLSQIAFRTIYHNSTFWRSVILSTEATAEVFAKTLAQVFSCDFCEISKNTFFTEHLWTAAFVSMGKQITLVCNNSCTLK